MLKQLMIDLECFLWRYDEIIIINNLKMDMLEEHDVHQHQHHHDDRINELAENGNKEKKEEKEKRERQREIKYKKKC